MILAPTSGPIGIQPHCGVSKVINRHSAAVAIGDVVITSFNHTSAAFTFTPVDDAALRLSPFSCVKLAKGDAAATNGNGGHAQAGFIGAVVGLGSQAGAAGTEIDVQFGGAVNALVAAATHNVVIGSKLFLSDTAGRLGNEADSTNPDTTVALALGSVTAGSTGIIPVLLFNGPIDGTATALT